jgi:hypothetical protein
MAYPPITTLPTAPSRSRPTVFADEADAFLSALPTFGTQANALADYVEGQATDVDTDATAAASSASSASASATSAAASATAAAQVAAAWVSGASYTVGAVVYSPIDFQTYRAITTHSGLTTDPSEDATNWVAIGGGGGGGGLTSQTATTTTTSQTSVATYDIAEYTAMELTVVSDSASNRTITKLLVVHNGTTASATQYGEVSTGTTLATYDVDISGGNVRLLATPASATSTDFTTKENLFTPVA